MIGKSSLTIRLPNGESLRPAPGDPPFEASGNLSDLKAYLKLGWIEKFEEPEPAPEPVPDETTPDEDADKGEKKPEE